MRTVISVIDLQSNLERERLRSARLEDALRRADMEIAAEDRTGRGLWVVRSLNSRILE